MAEIIVLGVVLSIIFYELTDISPGGIIVPGIMVLYISQPIKIVYTIVVALLSYLLVNLMSRKFIVFGKRRFALHILVAFLLHFIVNLILGLFAKDFTFISLSLVGYTVSGIIANNAQKQGAVKTVASLVIITGLLALIVIVLSALGVVL